MSAETRRHLRYAIVCVVGAVMLGAVVGAAAGGVYLLVAE